MIKAIELKNNNDYFLPLSKRNPKGIYYYSYIGYDDDIMIFLKKYQLETVKRGVYINEPIKNPTDNEVSRCNSVINDKFTLNINYIDRTIGEVLNDSSGTVVKILSESIYTVLDEINKNGANISILKNAYIKFLCWSLRFQSFIRFIGDDKPPKILYEGDISKYDYYMLKILSLSGCDIVYINFENEDTIKKYNFNVSKFIYGKNKGLPSEHFLDIDLRSIEEQISIKTEVNKISDTIVTNSWLKDEDFFQVLEKKNSVRGILINPNKIYNISIQYLGVDDKGKYNNRLLYLKKQLEESEKPFLLIDRKIDNPFAHEILDINKNNFNNKRKIIDIFAHNLNKNISGKMLPYIIKAFAEVLEEYNESNINKIYNLAMKLYCWINRYKNFIVYDGDNIPIVIYYGSSSVSEGIFLDMLSKLPLDIIYISPTKSICKELGGKVIELEDKLDIPLFPNKEMKVMASTTAYEAEKKIESLLYSDTGLYKNHQYKRSTPITLKTIYEEIYIIWNEEAKYRPSFQANDERVYVPNIFAKICGVKNGHVNNYIKEIKSLVTEKTIYFNKVPLLRKSPNISNESIRLAMTNNRINEENIKDIKEYKYHYLNINTQNFIIEKIQELIDLQWIKYDGSDLNKIILDTILDLDKETINLIQQFDFTKEIPKIVILHVDESMTNLIDCIYLLFLNLIGFDIIIFTPTGYTNIEKYINEESFENYIIGEFKFDIKPPNIKDIQVRKSSGFIDKFLRGR